jgi:hypothetical protein
MVEQHVGLPGVHHAVDGKPPVEALVAHDAGQVVDARGERVAAVLLEQFVAVVDEVAVDEGKACGGSDVAFHGAVNEGEGAAVPLGDEHVFQVRAAGEVVEHGVAARIAHDEQGVEAVIGHQLVEIGFHRCAFVAVCSSAVGRRNAPPNVRHSSQRRTLLTAPAPSRMATMYLTIFPAAVAVKKTQRGMRMAPATTPAASKKGMGRAAMTKMVQGPYLRV